MSLWHSPQRAESMKKFDGMMPPTFVFADEGKNGDPGPPPSFSMDSGTSSGLRMRSIERGLVLRKAPTPSGKMGTRHVATAATQANARSRALARTKRPKYGNMAI